MSRFLINATNLHVGGGVQVATSFLSELALFDDLPNGLAVWASKEVDDGLRRLGCDVKKLPGYKVLNTYGLKLLVSDIAREISRFDAVFTVFGPLYTLKPPAVSVVGFAQPWIVYPRNEVHEMMPVLERVSMRFKFWLQSFFFRLADELVVELDHVKVGLVRSGVGKADSIRVVHNCLSSLYKDDQNWQPVEIPRNHAGLKIGFVGRNYTHKNTKVFPLVRDVLKKKFDLDVIFYVTFTADEWTASSPEFQSAVVNVGSLSVAQCPSFYRKMDGVVFPSLLECFSATPLEAMAMKRPLFASDRPFNRDVCGRYAYYFDPKDPESIADAIAGYFLTEAGDQALLEEARIHAFSFSNASNRARQYLNCLQEVVGRKRLLYVTKE